MKKLKGLMDLYAALYLAIFPWVYLLHVPPRTSHKMALFLVLALPFIFRAPGVARRAEVRLYPWLATAALALLAAILVSGVTSLLMFADMPLRRIAGTMGMAAWLLAMVAMALSCDDACLQRALRWLTISTLLAVGAVFILDWTIDFVPGTSTGKLGLGLNTISLAKLLLAAVPGALLMRSGSLRLVLLVLLSVLIFMTGSRTMGIALLATVVTFVLLQGRVKQVISALGALVAGAAVGVAMVLWRGLGIQHLISLHTLQLRYEAWMNALAIWWRMNPITGTGPNMHRHYLHGPLRLDDLPFPFEAGHAHNEYIAALADLGIVGFTAWCALLAMLLFLLWKRRHEGLLARVALAIFIGYLVAGLAEVHFMRLREMTLVVVVMVMAFWAGVQRADNESPAFGLAPGSPRKG